MRRDLNNLLPANPPALDDSRVLELIRTHYELQKGAFIFEYEQTPDWIRVFSDVSSVPMWNHAAWIGASPCPPDPIGFIDEVCALWPEPSRPPVVFLVDAFDGSMAPLQGLEALEACEQESWMWYANPEPPPLSPSNNLEIRIVETDEELAEFVRVFRAAYQTRNPSYDKVFLPKHGDPRRVKHYLACADGKPVCTASLIALGNSAGIYNVGTAPQARNRGIAAHLASRLIRDALDAGLGWIFLQAVKGSSAERLYARLGFQIGFVRTGYRLTGWKKGKGKPANVHGPPAPEFLAALHHERHTGLRKEQGVLPVTCPAGLGQVVQACAAATGVSCKTVWIAGWAALLCRYSHETRVGFGLRAAAGKPPVTLWLDVREQEQIAPWLKAVEERVTIAEQSGETAEPMTADSSVVWNTSPEPTAHWTGCPLELLMPASASSDLVLLYDRAKMDEGAVARLAGHLLTLLREMASRPRQIVGSLQILTPQERRFLEQCWRPSTPGNALDYRPTHRLFEAAVLRKPSAPAVLLASSKEPSTLTYGELNQRANQLARSLQNLGVGPEKVVALCVERSLEMIVAVWAILKAGGVCLPLEPTLPRERLQYMVTDAKAALVLTTERFLADRALGGAKSFALDTHSADLHANSGENLDVTSAPDHAAYVIYTSGSTGQPKGVIISHGAIATHCLDAATGYGLGPDDRVLQFNSLSFDAAFEQIIAPLISGATLVVRGPEVWTVQEFGQALERFELTVADLPTAYWHQVLTEWTQHVAVLPRHFPRLVIVGGEAMSPESLRLWRRLPWHEVTLINAYGPTETTVTATAFEVTGSFLAQPLPRRIPIGRPRGGRSAYVLDAQGRPVPVGVTGELYLGGPLLARGYLNRPELTQEKFVQDPFSSAPDDRLYRTGDLVRLLPDGNLEFLGRADQQVKIRGYRVELGEIEAALLHHPEVRESVVTVGESAGHRHLAAYIVPRNGQSPSARELRAFLRNRLPDYMLPRAFVSLNTLPLLSSGKVDRRALPAADPEPETESVTGPRDPMELRLQLVFERVLQRGGIGVDASFFELGGNSLQALELIIEIERLTGQRLPLETLYQSSNVESLARLLEDQQRAEDSSSLVPLQPGVARPPLFLLHTTPGDILGYGNLIYHLDPRQPCYGLQSLGLLRPESSHTRIEQMAGYYLDLLRGHQPEGPYYLAGWCYGGIVAVEMAQQLLAAGQKVAFIGLLETVALAPSWRIYKYYQHRLSCLLAMRPRQWFRYFRHKMVYYRKFRRASTMRFRRLEQVAGTDPAGLEEHNRKLTTLEHVYKANLNALRHYRPRPYPGRVTLFNAGESDPGMIPDPLYAWPGLASEVEVHVVPGNHDTMLTEPNVAVLAVKLDDCLRQAQKLAPSRDRPAGALAQAV